MHVIKTNNSIDQHKWPTNGCIEWLTALVGWKIANE